MDGDENLPKATMSSFVKENLQGMKCSNEFIEFILKVSREYISIIADEANKICLQNGKKTIAPIFIYEALKQHQLQSQIEVLEDVKQKFTEENHKANNEVFKNPEMIRMLSQQQEQFYEMQKNKSEAQIIGLDKIQSGEDYKSIGLHEIIKSSDQLLQKEAIFAKEQKQCQMQDEEEEDDDDNDDEDDYDN